MANEGPTLGLRKDLCILEHNDPKIKTDSGTSFPVISKNGTGPNNAAVGAVFTVINAKY
jgi:hypothetical protein